MSKSNTIKTNFWSGIFVIAICIYIILESIQMRDFGSNVASAGITPFLVGLSMILLALGLVINALKDAKQTSLISGKSIKDQLFSVGMGNVKEKNMRINKGITRLIFIVVITFTYVSILFKVGFIPASIIYLFVCFIILKNINKWHIVVISIAYPVIVKYIFEVVFKVYF